MEQYWTNPQQCLAEHSKNGNFVLAEQSGHLIQHEQPKVVVGTIRDLVAELNKSP